MSTGGSARGTNRVVSRIFSGVKTLTIELSQELSPQQEHDLKMELAGMLYTKGLAALSQGLCITLRAAAEYSQPPVGFLNTLLPTNFCHEVRFNVAHCSF